MKRAAGSYLFGIDIVIGLDVTGFSPAKFLSVADTETSMRVPSRTLGLLTILASRLIKRGVA